MWWNKITLEKVILWSGVQIPPGPPNNTIKEYIMAWYQKSDGTQGWKPEPENKYKPATDSSKADKYWQDMEDRKKAHRNWEDRGEPIGF